MTLPAAAPATRAPARRLRATPLPLLCALLCALLLSACATPTPLPRVAVPYVPQTLGPQQRQAALDLVWQSIQQQYVDPRFNGADWAAVGRRYRAELLQPGLDEAAFWRGLNRMAGELKDAHTTVRSPLEVNATLQQRGHHGLGLQKLQGHWVVSGLSGNSQAALLGVRAGHRVLQIDNQDFDRWWQATAATVRGSSTDRSNFGLVLRELNQRPVGSLMALQLQRPDGSRYRVTLRQDPLSPAQAVLRAHLLASNLGYLRFANFNPALKTELEAALKRLSGAQALVLDLRGNGGGSFKMAVDLMGWLLPQGGSMGEIITRDNQRLTAMMGLVDVTPTLNVTLQPQPLAMPMAVLIDENSASASELLASVLQDRGRARVFGVPSCGCLLGARAGGIELPGGGRLMMSQFDMRIGAPPGKRIEGVGVQPDAPVPWTEEALRAQRDVVFEAAQSWLMGPAAAEAL